MEQVRAIVFPTTNQVEIQSYDLPALRPDEVLVRTEYSGVSQGTEIWALTGRRVELSFPTVPGYQSVGVITAVGEAVPNWQPGQRVLFATNRMPGHLTPTWMGAHASHALVNAQRDILVPVPDEVDPVAAALAALPAVSLRGLEMLDIKIGDLVVVTGQGLIGQGSAQLARLRGAIVLATDLSAERRERSQAHSADIVLDPAAQDLAGAVRALKPAGADVVIETTGRAEQFAPCVALLRWEGQLLLQGFYPNPITFDFNVTHAKKPKIAVTCGFDAPGVTTVLQLLRYGKLHLRELVTHCVPFTAAPELYPKMAAGDPSLAGVVFDWRQL